MTRRITKTYVKNDKTIVIAPQIHDYVEDGVYNGEIIDAEIAKASTGNFYLRTTIEMNDGKTGVYNIYLDENPFGNFGQLIKIGFKDKVKEVEVEDLIGLKIKVYLKTKDSRQNIIGIESPDEEIEEDEKVENDRHTRGQRQSGSRSGVGRGGRKTSREYDEEDDDNTEYDEEDDDEDDL